MYVLGCCNADGVCIGFLSKNKTIISDENKLTAEYLMTFNAKKDTNNICNQINLSNLLLKDGYPYRVVPIKM